MAGRAGNSHVEEAARLFKPLKRSGVERSREEFIIAAEQEYVLPLKPFRLVNCGKCDAFVH